MTAERVDLTTPVGHDWAAVARLVLGGIGDRLDLGFDELDDLQLAVERLLAEAGAGKSVRITVEIVDEGLRTDVGPLDETTIAEALQGPPPATGELGLRRVLETVVDAFGIERVSGDGLYVRLEKSVRQSP